MWKSIPIDLMFSIQTMNGAPNDGLKYSLKRMGTAVPLLNHADIHAEREY